MGIKKIFILLGHPDVDTFSGALAGEYERGARQAGYEVRRTNLGEVSFDPILHKGYKEIQELEPGLVKIQEDISWADHLVILYPNWWNTMPALLKGMFDRLWLPDFAFNFDKQTKKIIQRLMGRSARVIIVSGTNSPWKTRMLYGDYTNEIEKGILGFAGFSPVKISAFGPCEQCGNNQQEAWKKRVYELGKKGI